MSKIENEHSNDPRKLFEAVQNGDTEAFGALYTLYYTPIYRYFYFRLKDKDEARDLTQTVFLKVFKVRENITGTLHEPLSYFYTVARNTLIDYRRKNKETLSLDETMLDIPAPEEDLEEKLNDKILFKELEKAFNILTQEQREVITLKFIEDQSNTEIASILGKREEAIRQLQSRAIRLLKKYFNHET